MKDPYLEIPQRLDRGESLVLARIIRQAGSAPRGVGTRCLVLADGTIVGTIGGGLLEHLVRQGALEALAVGKPRILHFQLKGKDVARTDMLCGGIVDVYLEPLDPGDVHCRELFSKLEAMVREGQGGVLITRVAGGADSGSLGGRILLAARDIPDGLPEALRAVMGRLRGDRPALVEMEGEDPLFWEPVASQEVLYLFGAGHISTFVAPLARMVGFKVVVIDDRAEFANPERFPSADEILVLSPKEALGRIHLSPNSYVAIITRGHQHDASVLRLVAGRDLQYIGMIGSRRKKAMVYKAMMEEGISREALDKVHCPIGLDIGAETPEEIAVSIVAELIQVRAASRAASSGLGGALG